MNIDLQGIFTYNKKIMLKYIEYSKRNIWG